MFSCTNTESRIAVIDYDWAGKANEAKYPLWMNPACNWPQGASCGGIITVDHDNYWIDRNLTNNPLRREECIATVIISCDGNDPLRRIPVSAPAPCSSRCHEAFDKNTMDGHAVYVVQKKTENGKSMVHKLGAFTATGIRDGNVRLGRPRDGNVRLIRFYRGSTRPPCEGETQFIAITCCEMCLQIPAAWLTFLFEHPENTSMAIHAPLRTHLHTHLHTP
eukprot:Em0612g5a